MKKESPHPNSSAADASPDPHDVTGKGLPSHFAKYSDLFEKLLDATLLLDLDTFLVLDANPACGRFLQLELSQILGQPIFRWVSPHEHENLKKALVTARNQYQPLEISCRFQNERRPFLIVRAVICTLTLSNGNKVLQLIAKDITEEHEAKQRSVDQLIKIAEMNRRLEILSVTDELTQIFNVRCFKEKLIQEHARSLRYGLTYSILFCDVDHFKQYNDLNGHLAGDDLLKKLAQLFKGAVRSTDVVARYGGEEFVILCPETTDTNAEKLAERLRKQVESFPFLNAASQPLGTISISIGVASYPNDGSAAEEVFQAADQAVYTSKHQGRNRVTLARTINRAELPCSKKRLL